MRSFAYVCLLSWASFVAAADLTAAKVDQAVWKNLDILFPDLKHVCPDAEKEFKTVEREDGFHSTIVFKCGAIKDIRKLNTLVLYAAHAVGVELVKGVPIVEAIVFVQTPSGKGEAKIPLKQAKAIGQELLRPTTPDAIKDRVFDFAGASSSVGLTPALSR